MPIYVRAGAIIPVDPVRQYTGEPVTEPTTLQVFAGANGQFTLYDDDGISQEYLRARQLDPDDVERRAGQLTLEPGAPPGATNLVAARTFTVRVLPEGVTRQVSVLREAGSGPILTPLRHACVSLH